MVEKCSRGGDRNVPDNQLLARLVTLYEEANSWYNRQQILSIFVCDHPKSELLNLIPGLTKWRIDEARKHAFHNEPGQQIEPPQIKRSRLQRLITFLISFLVRLFCKMSRMEQKS